MREDSFCHVEPAVWTPGEAVEEFVPIFHAEAGFQNGRLIGLAIAIRVLQEIKIRSGPDIDSAVAERQAGGETEAIGEDGHFIGAAIAVGVLKNFDAIAAWFAFGSSF